MKKTSVYASRIPRVLGLIISLCALPLLLTMTGCTTGSGYEQRTGESVADRGISSRVRAVLGQDEQYKYDSVRVETLNGSVELSGFVTSVAQKDRAGELASRLDGVRKVMNNITVRESAG